VSADGAQNSEFSRSIKYSELRPNVTGSDPADIELVLRKKAS